MLKTRAKREPNVEEEVDKNVGQQHNVVEQQTSASTLTLTYRCRKAKGLLLVCSKIQLGYLYLSFVVPTKCRKDALF